jgi:hypothetical protein
VADRREVLQLRSECSPHGLPPNLRAHDNSEHASSSEAHYPQPKNLAEDLHAYNLALKLQDGNRCGA